MSLTYVVRRKESDLKREKENKNENKNQMRVYVLLIWPLVNRPWIRLL